MRYNGLQLVIDMALNKMAEPTLSRYRDAIVLGAIREDICWLPFRRRVWEHFSLSHFAGRLLPGGFIPFFSFSAAGSAQRLFVCTKKALAKGDEASAHVLLGRIAHLLIDMACPVHAQRVAHWSDGYEWWIETHVKELQQLPVDEAPSYGSVKATIKGLARYTQQHAADGTHHHLGRWLQQRGWRRSLTRAECEAQARTIIPIAASHLVNVLELFLAARRDAIACQ